MPYDIEPTLTQDRWQGVFQRITATLSVMVPGDARSPIDHDEYIIPATTPMAPVHTGTDHDHGLWMPIRRTRVYTVATSPVTEMVVDDAEPFAVGDTVHAIDVAGPNTGCTDLGAITDIDYDTNTITVTNNATGLNVDDWIEVTENGCVVVADDEFRHPAMVGMLQVAHDVRATASATSGTLMDTHVVIRGAIRESDLSFNVDATNDELLIAQFMELSPNADGINIITAQHGDESVQVPDEGYES